MKTMNKKLRKIKNTRRKSGGNLFQNIVNLVNKDKKINKNYYETEIKFNKKTYKLNYFTPSNALMFKTTDQIRTPTFKIFTDHLQKEPNDYKIMIGDVYVNTIVILDGKWYVITRTLDNYKKGKMFTEGLLYYRIKNVFTNKEEKLSLKTKIDTIKDNIIKITNYTLLKKEHTSYKILDQFYMQQDTGELVKDVVVTDVVINAADAADDFF